MESLLGDVRSGKVQINVEMVDTLINSNDCLKSLIDDVYKSDTKDVSKFIECIKSLVQQDDKITGGALISEIPKSIEDLEKANILHVTKKC